jgi:hypothetical protein
MDELNLITNEVEIEYFDLRELTYEWKSTWFVELFVNDFYTGDCEVYLDEEMCNRPYIELNYEIIYLDWICEKKGEC